MKKHAKPSEPKLPEQLNFHYIKSNFFRVIHADGMHGGVSHNGSIHMALFNERPAIPQQVVHKVTKDGSLGSEIREERVTRDAIVREVAVEVLMSLRTAKSLHKWLGEHVKRLEKALKEQEAK